MWEIKEIFDMVEYKFTLCKHCNFITVTLDDGTCDRCKKDKSKEEVNK